MAHLIFLILLTLLVVVTIWLGFKGFKQKNKRYTIAFFVLYALDIIVILPYIYEL
ncbi:hypothetical protein [Lacticaseibacillus absianus]|uniref:hypothetical protein n=1 Tax=Lacticaseibacillus absianus TaxID=2729623 RepID=UPI0015CBBD5E|nr:hypothetical protein [Lacticaseibacillus absianus]